jgi:aspartyl-tRNA(Asn)/glutamyl-tRNA(Gln) amidotransferase subunit C
VLTREEVLHIARLARLALSDAEVERMAADLGHILDHIQRLNALDTAAIPPTAQVADLVNVWREDVLEPGLTREAALAAAPVRAGGHFKVKAIQE